MSKFIFVDNVKFTYELLFICDKIDKLKISYNVRILFIWVTTRKSSITDEILLIKFYL